MKTIKIDNGYFDVNFIHPTEYAMLSFGKYVPFCKLVVIGSILPISISTAFSQTLAPANFHHPAFNSDTSSVKAPPNIVSNGLNPEKNKPIPTKDSSANRIKNYFKAFNTFNDISGFTKHIKYTGNLSVDGQYATLKDTFSAIPPEYLRFTTRQSITIYSIPLSLNVSYGTDKGFYGENLRFINLGFDCGQFRQNINQRIAQEQKQAMDIEHFDDYKYKSQQFSFEDSLASYRPKAPQAQSITSSIYNTGDEPYIKALRNIRNMQKMDITDYSRLKDSVHGNHPGYSKELDSLEQYRKILSLKDGDEKKQAEDSLKINYPDKYKTYLKLKKIEALEQYKKGDLSNHLDDLKKNGLISNEERILLGFKKAGIGDNYPMFSPMALSGTKVRGAEAEYEDGNLYSAFCYGKTISPFYSNTMQPLIPERHITAGAIGYGNTNATHLHLFLIKANTRTNNSALNKILHDTIDNVPDTLVTNYVLGADLAILLNRHLKFEAEMDKSTLTRDNFSLSGLLNGDKNTALSSMLTYRDTRNTTIMSAVVKKVDPDYVSYGVPFLISDNLSYGLNLTKKFYSNRVIIETDFSRQQNNLAGQAPGTTYINSMSGNINIAFPGLPYVIITYTPYTQSNTTSVDSLHFFNKVSIVTASTGYQYQLGRYMSNTAFNIIHEEGQFAFSQYHVNSTLISLNEVFRVNSKLMFSSTVGYSIPGANSDTLQVKMIDGEVDYTLNRYSSVTTGYIYEEDAHFYTSNGVHAGVATQINKHNRLEIRIEEKKMEYIAEPEKNRNIETAFVRYVVMW